MKNSHSSFPWMGVALVVVSLVGCINSFRVAYLSVQLRELKKTQGLFIKTDSEIVKTIKQIEKIETTVFKQVEQLRKDSPVNCLQEHRYIHKNYLDSLVMIAKLTTRIENLERKSK